jgi:type IV pilus assembly protein PilA
VGGAARQSRPAFAFFEEVRSMQRDERGFTLIELLVVIIIIGILAAIAIPVYLGQREKAWRTQAVSDMKNAATAIESYATDTGGDYSGVNGANQSSLALVGQGFRHGSLVAVTVQSTPSTYCIRGFHNLLTDEFVMRSSDGVVKHGPAGSLPC